MSRTSQLLTLAAVLVLSPVPARGDPPKTDLAGDPLPDGAVARLGTVRLRHTNWIGALAFSPDGKALAAENPDGDSYRGLGWSDRRGGAIRMWDPATGKELARPQGDTGVAYFLAFSGKFLLAASDDGRIRLWDFKTGTAIETPGGLSGVYAAAMSPDRKTLAAGSQGKVRVIDLGSGKDLTQFTPPGPYVLALHFSPDGKTLAAASSGLRDKEGVCLWDVASGRELLRLPAEADGRAIALSPDGKVLATGGNTQPVRLWDVASGKEARTLGDAGGARFVAFLPAGKELLVAGTAGATVWNVGTGEEVRRLGEKSLRAFAAALSPDGKTLAVSEGNAIRLFDVATGTELLPSSAPVSAIEAVAFSPDGKAVLTGGAGLRLWDSTTGKELAALRDLSRVGAAAFTPDGKQVVAGYSTEQAIRVWDAAGGRELRHFDGDSGEVEYVGLLGGKSVVSMSQQRTTRGPTSTVQKREMSLRVWDLTTGKETRQIAHEMMHRATSSADGRRVAGGMHQLGVWDALTGRELARFDPPSRGNRVLALAFTPDGRRLACAYFMGGPIRVREVLTGAEVGRLAGHDRVTLALAVAPDGRLVASGGSDGTVRLWDLGTGKELRKLAGHRGPVLALAFSPDGRRLISGGSDATALVWDVAGVLPAPAGDRLKAEELKSLWLTLADLDGGVALRAVRRLASSPDEALPLIRERIGKEPAPDRERLARLLADLDAEDFEKREAATGELVRLGKLAEGALRGALENKPSAEVRVRVEGLLKKLDSRQMAPGELQALRALEVLEMIGTPQAREVIQSAAKGATSTRVEEEAKAALERLGRRGRTAAR